MRTTACLALALLLHSGDRVLAQASEASGPRKGAGRLASKEGPLASEVGFDQRLGADVPLDLVLRDERGKAVRLGDLVRDRPVILTLAYFRCPMLCTLVLNGQVRAMQGLPLRLGEDYEAVTVSFDPRDTPEVAAAKKANYALEYNRPGAHTGWHFLTGDEESVRRLAEAVGFRYALDPATGEYAHASGLVVLTPGGRVARYLYGIGFSPRDLRLGLVEASEGRVGSPVDQVLLLCFQYDAAAGQYKAAALGLVRLGGIVTLVSLAAYVLRSLWRERHPRGPAEAGAAQPAGGGDYV